MAYSAPYTQGTISLDPDDASIVVGNGTLWSTVALPNDKIEALGLAVSIQEVTDDTHLKLYYDWPGTAPDSAAYVLNFTSEKRGTNADLASVVREQINRLRIFDQAVAVFSVKKFAINSPPGDAIVGDRYVVGAAGTSDFAGHNNEIAEKTETGYLFTIPQHGYHVIDEEQNFVRAWTGAAWSSGVGFGAALTYAGPWDAETVFKIGNVTTHRNRVWIAKADNSNSEPASGSEDWDLFINVGEDGGAFALRYVFKSAVDDSDPGTGSLKFNNSPGSATVMRVSKTDTYGNDWSALIAGINSSTTSIAKGKVRIVAKGDKTKQVVASVTAATAVDDYFNLTVSSPVTSAADLADGDEVVFLFQERGDAGSAASISVGTVTTLNPDQPATVANGGTSAAAIFNFGIPRGLTGAAATIAVGTVTTLDPDADATVDNSGTSGAAVLDFGIPKGDTGPTGPQGQGIQPDASGPLADRNTYDDEAAGFVFVDTDATPFDIYIKLSATTADWSAASPIGGEGDMLSSVYDPDGIEGDVFDSVNSKFSAGGTGAVSRSVRSKLRDVVSVSDYGAVGDGVTDDTAAFKAARDYLQVNSDYRGGTLYIPKGRYKLTDEIAFTSYAVGSVHNIYIQGAGILATTLDFSGAPAGTNGISFNAGVHFGIADMMITGAKKNGINIDGVADFAAMFTLERLRVQNSTSNGIYVRNAWLQTYKDIWSVSNGANGFVFTGFHTSLKAERCFASLNSSGSGFAINAVTYGSFITCASDENQRGYALSNLNGVSFIACGTEGNANDGWLLQTSDALSSGVLANCENIRGVSFLNCFNLGNGTATPGSFGTFMALVTANSRPIEISIEGCTSWRANVSDPAIVAAGTSGTISIHEKMNAFDGAWATSGIVRRNSQSGAAVHLTGGANSLQVGTFSSTGATRGTLIDAATFNHSGTGTGTEFVGAFYNANGLVGTIQTGGSSTSYVTTSDEDLKSFLGEMDPAKAIEIILADPVREFTWKADGQHAVGWGAQTSYAVSPDLAVPGRGKLGDDDYMPWGVDQSKRTPYLWAAVSWAIGRIKEQSRVIDELRQAISGLEGK